MSTDQSSDADGERSLTTLVVVRRIGIHSTKIVRSATRLKKERIETIVDNHGTNQACVVDGHRLLWFDTGDFQAKGTGSVLFRDERFIGVVNSYGRE